MPTANILKKKIASRATAIYVPHRFVDHTECSKSVTYDVP